MLNDEGWGLLMFLLLFMAALLIGIGRLRRERSMTERLTVPEGYFSRNSGLSLRLCGSVLLCVLPGLFYRNGLLTVVALVSLLMGAGALLFFLLPKLPSKGVLTPVEALSLSPKPRVCAALASLLPTFILTAAALMVCARFVAGVFSLHYLISLVAVTAVSVLLCLLKTARSRAVSDRFLAFLPVSVTGVLAGALILVKGDSLAENLAFTFSVEDSLLPLLSFACIGIGVPGLLLPMQRELASQSAQKKKGLLTFLLFTVVLLFSAFCGLFGSLADNSLTDAVACETVLLQLSPLLPSPLRGLCCAGLILLAMLYVQDGLKAMSALLVWDVIQPLHELMPDKRLLTLSRLSVPAFAPLLFLAAMPETLPLLSYVTLALLLSAPLGMVHFAPRRSGKRTILALLVGELLAVTGFVCSYVFVELGFLPAFPAALSTLLILLIGGNKHRKD